MSPGKHKYPPIPFRPPEGDRGWLLEHARQTGQPVNRILALALAAYRAGQSPTPDNSSGT
jgi:hypothetical protein